MSIDDINASNFVDARSHEIQYLESEILKTRKKSLLSQRLPFHKRRRTHCKHINKKRFNRRTNVRQKQKHIYYHKRFTMINIRNVFVPLKRRMKSDKFIYKSAKRGYMFVENYKSAVLYCNEECSVDESEFEKVIKSVDENVLKCICFLNELYEVYKCGNYVVIIGIEQPEMLYYKMVRKLGIPISVMEGEYKFTCHVGDLFQSYVNQNQTLQNNENSVVDDKNPRLKSSTENKICMFKNVLVLESQGPVEKYKIIAEINIFREVHDFIMKIKYIPISILELFRIGTENKMIMYPFDNPESSFYSEFEKSVYESDYNKWKLMPKGKRVNYEHFKIDSPWFLPENFSSCQKVFNAYYDVQKGSITRMALIYDKNNVVGYVLRASYCYRIGKCRCLCVLNENPKDKYNVRNTNTFDFIEIMLSGVNNQIEL